MCNGGVWQVQADLAPLSSFSVAQVGELGSMVIDLLRDPRNSGFQVGAGIAYVCVYVVCVV